MKKLLLGFVLLVSLTGSIFAADVSRETVDHLQTVSVSIEAGQLSGSGVIKVRKFGENRVAFVFTAAHVVENLRSVKKIIDSKTGTERVLVEFADAKVVRTLVEDGRTIGRMEAFSKVIRYNQEEDLAVLQVRQKNFTNDSVSFYLDNVPNAIGTPVVHVGSLLGAAAGSNSMTTGIVSQLGRVIDAKVFDQTTAPGFPGSSGGGLFLNDGRMIGQVLRGSGESFVLFCPARRIVAWAKSAGVEWAVNDGVAVPTEKELAALPVEDNGVSFATSTPASKSFRKLIYKKSSVCPCGPTCNCSPCLCGD